MLYISGLFFVVRDELALYKAQKSDLCNIISTFVVLNLHQMMNFKVPYTIYHRYMCSTGVKYFTCSADNRSLNMTTIAGKCRFTNCLEDSVDLFSHKHVVHQHIVLEIMP